MQGLTFDADSHTYKLDGQAVPSVTQVLDENRLLPDYSTLDPYYAVRGTAVHEAIALDLLGRLDERTLDEHTRPYVDRARRFVQEFGIEPLVIEFRWADPIYRYAGTLDLFCRSSSGLLLVDWKAGQYEAAHALQVAGGYLPLLELAAHEGVVPVEPGEVRGARVAVVPLTQELPKPVWIERDDQVATFRAARLMMAWRAANPTRRAA